MTSNAEPGRGPSDPVAALDAAYEQVRNHDRTRDYPAGREKGRSLSSTEEWAEHDKAHAAWKAETDAIMDVSS